MVTDWLQAAFSAVSTAATVIIVILTWKTIKTYRDQVDLAQKQITISQEQKFNDARPVLVPSSHRDSIKTSDDKPSLALGTSLALFLDGIRNIGQGPALNIHGAVFFPIDQRFPPGDKRVFWNHAAISPLETTQQKIELGRGVNLTGNEEVVAGYSLYAPSTEEEIGVEARLTLTYRDVFDRKHASIYDYHERLGWVSKGHFPGIQFDLWELDEKTEITKQARASYLRAKKTAQV